MDWKLLSLVALGGAAGSIVRYLVSGWSTPGDFPTGTLVVNITGCFLIGLLMFGGAAGGWISPPIRLLLGIGLLGGFTTMSTFTYDTMALVESSEHLRALGNVSVTLVGCLAGTWLGRVVGLTLWAGGS